MFRLQGTEPFHSVATLDNHGKQKGIADNSESIVYLLVYMGLRFHRHSLSTYRPAEPTSKNQAKANMRNKRLADHLQSFIYTRIVKRTHIRMGRPPIKMQPTSDGRQPPLAILLRKLYGLLQEHRLAEMMDEENKFRERLLKKKPAGKKTKKVVPTEPVYYDFSWLEKIMGHPISRVKEPLSEADRAELRKKELDRKEEEARRLIPKAAFRAALLARMKKARRVLDDHDAIIDVFRSVIMDEQGKFKISPSIESDKYADQFLDLPATWGVRWEPTEKPKPDNGKRKARGAAQQDSGPPVKRRRV